MLSGKKILKWKRKGGKCERKDRKRKENEKIGSKRVK
jgi:hypothetical protein